MDRHWESSLHQHRHRMGARGEGGYTLYCGFRVLVSLFSCLTLPDQQKLRVKSPVLKKQACPQWKHSFVFNGVSSSQLRQSTLVLTVWDQAIFGMNDRLLGEARLGSKGGAAGCADSCSQSKLQWQKVLSSPNLWTDMTLVLH